MTIGIFGIGRMGGAMAERLLDQGQDIHVWNRSRGKAEALADKGAQVAATPAALAGACDILIGMLFDEAAQQAVYHGTDGLLSAPLDGKLVIDMSTVMPESARALAAAVTDAGADFVECPVGGTVAPARNGKLLGMAGGSAAAFARAKPVLEQLCRRVEHVGAPGAGAAMKLAVNLPLGVYWEALGEALSLAVAAGGVEPKLAGSLLADSSGAISVAAPRIPPVLQALTAKPGDSSAFDVAGMAKDLSLMARYAAESGFALPVAEAARQSYEAAAADGWRAKDAPMLAAWQCRRSRRG